MNARDWSKTVHHMLKEAIATMEHIPRMSTIEFQNQFSRTLIVATYTKVGLLGSYRYLKANPSDTRSFRDTLSNKELKSISDRELALTKALIEFLPYYTWVTTPEKLVELLEGHVDELSS